MEGFDLRTHIRDVKTGAVKKKQTYRLRIKNGIKVFERDGRCFYENGEEILAQEAKVQEDKIAIKSRS